MSAGMAQNNGGGRFHCLKCGRKHNRNSDVGSFHHFELDVEREGFDPEDVAVGIAFVKAAEDRSQPDATIDEIKENFEELGFDDQFSNVDVGEKVRQWKSISLIGDVRHSGKHWFGFLANRGTPRDADRSPESFHLWMKRFASEFERASER